MTLPRGMPPTPSAMSRDSAPVEIVGTSSFVALPNFIIVPLPYCFSICDTARSRACCRFSLSASSGLDIIIHPYKKVIRFIKLNQHYVTSYIWVPQVKGYSSSKPPVLYILSQNETHCTNSGTP